MSENPRTSKGEAKKADASSPSSSSTAAAPTSPKQPLRLYYFNICGRAEPIRLAFHMGKLPFEDIRLTAEQWKVLKPRCPYGQLPVLEVDGIQIAQTNAILRLVGKWSGLYPENDAILAARIDEIIYVVDDISNKIFAVIGLNVGKEPKEAQRKHVMEDILPKYLEMLDRKFAGGYLFGDRPTIADLSVFSLVQWLSTGIVCGISAATFCPYPNLMKLYQKVVAEERLQGYLEKHGTTRIRSLIQNFISEFSDIFSCHIKKSMHMSMDLKHDGKRSNSGASEAVSKDGGSDGSNKSKNAAPEGVAMETPSHCENGIEQKSEDDGEGTKTGASKIHNPFKKCNQLCEASPLRKCVSSSDKQQGVADESEASIADNPTKKPKTA